MKTMFNNHAQIQQWLAIYADLSPGQRAAVDQHIATCETCAHNWRVDQELSHTLSAIIEQRRQLLALQPAAQPQQAAARFRTSIRQTAWKQRWEVSPRSRWMAVAVTLFVLIFLGTGLGQVWGGISLLTHVYATGTPQINTPSVRATQGGAEGVSTPAFATPQPAGVGQNEVDARQGIETALALEFEARRANDAQKIGAYVDPDAGPVWLSQYQSSTGIGTQSTPVRWIDYEIGEVVLGGNHDSDRARVRVRITLNSTMQQEIVEGRFYRHVDNRWLLTAPDVDAWGKVYRLETERFSIQYRQLDADVVRAAAGEVEAAYQKMVDTLAVSQERAGDHFSPFYEGKFHYDVVPKEVNRWAAGTLTYTITSPFLRTLPNQEDAVSALAYAMMVPIGLGLLDEVYQRPTTFWWNPINLGVSQWVMEDSMPNPPWRGSAAMAELMQTFVDASYPVTMDALLKLADPGQEQAAGMLLMDYIVAVYGREEIARFMGSLNQYDGWDDLIPAVFGVSVAEFETKWNRWLGEQYPVSSGE